MPSRLIETMQPVKGALESRHNETEEWILASDRRDRMTSSTHEGERSLFGRIYPAASTLAVHKAAFESVQPRILLVVSAKPWIDAKSAGAIYLI